MAIGFENEKEAREYKKRFDRFIAGLEKLSKKHKITISVTGGVILFPPNAKLDNLTYTNDHTSGDITPRFEIRKKVL